MSESQRIEGNRVYCHVCDHEWDRAQGGLQCPACESEFVEIIDPNSRSRTNSPPPVPLHPQSNSTSPPPIPPHPRSPHTPQMLNPFDNHHPWAPDPDEDDITTFEFNSPGGRGTFSFTSRTYTFGGGNMRTSTSRDLAGDEISRSFENMLGNIMGINNRRPPTLGGNVFEFTTTRNDRGFGSTQQGQSQDLFSMLFSGGMGPNQQHQQNSGQSMGALDLLGAMLNQANIRRGDTVFSQDAFDRVMTQLMEQNQSNAPGPATESAIAGLKKKPVDESMMGSDGKAECSICMDNLTLGQEVTVLPCNHWFHGDCVISWLREHDTCPHCRQAISNADSGSNSSPSSRRRRSSRRSSSVASPINQNSENINRAGPFPDTPSGLRDARQRYYGSRGQSDSPNDRPPRERRSSERSQRSTDNGVGGSVAGWIRSRLPFSGQQ